MKTLHVISWSAGKDSTACMLIALEKIGRERTRFVMADTGNEDQEVFSYREYIQKKLDVEIEIVRGDFSALIFEKRKFIARDQRVGRKNGKKIRWTNKAKRRALSILYPSGIPFLDLCLWKGRFPSRKAQFCTEQLKKHTITDYQQSLVAQGFNVVSWQGVRRDESGNRRDALKVERLEPGIIAYRPLVEWTSIQVVNFVRSKGVMLNPLYSEGFDRVGCMPCINSSKEDIRQMASRRPDVVEKLKHWEYCVKQASKRGVSTFFPALEREKHLKKDGIEEIIEWALTDRGGKQFMLFNEKPLSGCASSYGLCE